MSTFTWSEMIAGFRSFGGIVENIEQKEGRFGLGLFPSDHTQPFKLFVPEHLLVDVNQISLNGSDLAINDPSLYPSGFSDWFTLFQRHFSWGAEGRQSVSEFEAKLTEIPSNILQTLQSYGILNLKIRHEKPWDQMLVDRFLQSRCFRYQGKKILMPILELVNHKGSAKGFHVSNGIGIDGRCDDEIYVSYSSLDPLARFFAYGFVDDEEVRADSMPMKIEFLGHTIYITRGLNTEAKSLKKLNNLPLPLVQNNGNTISITGLMLAHRQAPRMPKTLLRASLNSFPSEAVDELFERVQSYNYKKCIELMSATVNIEGQFMGELRKSILAQMLLLTNCFGIRDDLV